MRKDRTFSDRKLTREEFSNKYWLKGKAPYQYHTAEIEDGRDEREQFIINNIRALYEMRKIYVTDAPTTTEFRQMKDQVKRLRRLCVAAVITTALGVAILISLFQ